MSPNRDLEKGATTTLDHQKSSSSGSASSSDSSTTDSPSPPETPPSSDESPPPQYVEAEVQNLPRIYHAPHSSTPPRRGNRRNVTYNSASARLGAIDEHSNAVAPDIPTRNPARKYVHFNIPSAAKYFRFGAAKSTVPPPNAYDSIIGPRGEKFADVRQNKGIKQPRPPSGSRKLCFILVPLLLILVTALGVGLGVGLTRHRNRNIVDVNGTGSADSNTNDAQPFPIGTYTIPTYLTNTTTSCTSNPSTWRCYPFTSYTSTDASSSFSTLLWQITSPTNSTLDLQISNTDPVFSYPFTDVSLDLSDANDVRLSAFTFTFNYRKQVVPSTDITGDNIATRCYYNDTLVSVRLYNNAQGVGGNIVGTPQGWNGVTGGDGDWPYAIEYEETINSGPECFRYVNGQDTDAFEVAAGNGGDCACSYRNYQLE